MSAISEPTTVVMFWNFLIIHQNFLLPQVKRSVIVSNKNGLSLKRRFGGCGHGFGGCDGFSGFSGFDGFDGFGGFGF